MNLNKNQLYHFCPEWMLESIKKYGLTEGKIIISQNPVRFRVGQWLTKNPDWNQSWDAFSTLPYKRNEKRLLIEIDNRMSRYLFKWADHGVRLAGQQMYDILSEFGDPENWFVFIGAIKPSCIKEVKTKPIIIKPFC